LLKRRQAKPAAAREKNENRHRGQSLSFFSWVSFAGELGIETASSC
jgi:hypothetical protein